MFLDKYKTCNEVSSVNLVSDWHFELNQENDELISNQ